MEPTISLAISIFIFPMPRKKEKSVVGKVIVAKAIGIFILEIGRIRFVINRLGRGKRITERKEIN